MGDDKELLTQIIENQKNIDTKLSIIQRGQNYKTDNPYDVSEGEIREFAELLKPLSREQKRVVAHKILDIQLDALE